MSWWSKFPTLIRFIGPELALELCHHTEAVVTSMAEFFEREGLDIHYRHSGWLWTATNHAQMDAWRPTIDKLAEFDQHPFVELTGAELAERAGSKRFIGGVHEASVATVQPAKLARALRTAALRRGVRIFERTEMTQLDRGSPSVVHTSSGAVTVAGGGDRDERVGRQDPRAEPAAGRDLNRRIRHPAARRAAAAGPRRRQRRDRLSPADHRLPRHEGWPHRRLAERRRADLRRTARRPVRRSRAQGCRR